MLNPRIGSFTVPREHPNAGFQAIRRGRDRLRAFDVQLQSPAYFSGLRDGYVITHMNGRDAGALTLNQVRRTLNGERPLRITWNHDGHVQAAMVRLQGQPLEDARAAEREIQVRHQAQDARAAQRRRMNGDFTRDDMVQFLVNEQPIRAQFNITHMRLKYAPSCEHCGARIFQVEKKLSKIKCCINGACFDPSFMPQLQPLPPRMKQYLVNHCRVLSHQSLKINQSLNLAALAIEPSRREGGWGLVRENIPHARLQCLSYHGRLHRYIRPGNDPTTPAK